MTAPLQPMLARRQLRLAALAAINGIKTAAGIVTVDSPGDWSTPPEAMPAVLLRNSRDRKDSVNKGMPEFTTTITLEIEARVEAVDSSTAQDNIEALVYNIENALFTDYNVISMIQQIASVDSEIEITADGRRHLGGVKMSIVFEMFEAFDPAAPLPVLSQWPVVQPATTGLTDVEINVDLIQPFDANGTYANPPFPASVLPAPRTSGPDGRNEGGLSITLPQ